MVEDPARGVLVGVSRVIVSGWLPTPPYFFQSWGWTLGEWQTGTWTPLSGPPAGISPQLQPAPPEFKLSYDPVRARVVLHGDLVHGTYEWDGQALSLASPDVLGFSDQYGAVAVDPTRGRIMVLKTDPTFRQLEYVSLDPAGVAPFGSGCPGSLGVPALDRAPHSMPWTGDAFELRVDAVPAGALAGLALGLSNSTWNGQPLPQPLDGLGLPRCQLFVALHAIDPMVVTAPEARLTMPIPATPQLAGQRVFMQCGLLNAGGGGAFGGAVTNALDVTVGVR